MSDAWCCVYCRSFPYPLISSGFSLPVLDIRKEFLLAVSISVFIAIVSLFYVEGLMGVFILFL